MKKKIVLSILLFLLIVGVVIAVKNWSYIFSNLVTKRIEKVEMIEKKKLVTSAGVNIASDNTFLSIEKRRR